MNNRISVIGSNSFSGSHFVDHVLNHGYQVTGISRSPEPHEVFLPYRKNKNISNFSFIQLDLNHHLNEITEILKKNQPAYIVNFAAQSMVGESWQYPEHWFQTLG